ncbi:MAG: hypothetical protein JXI43_04755 [Tissierellales bacterium]|nr:hypothetical protein [Tissierellales bacterium]
MRIGIKWSLIVFAVCLASQSEPSNVEIPLSPSLNEVMQSSNNYQRTNLDSLIKVDSIGKILGWSVDQIKIIKKEIDLIQQNDSIQTQQIFELQKDNKYDAEIINWLVMRVSKIDDRFLSATLKYTKDDIQNINDYLKWRENTKILLVSYNRMACNKHDSNTQVPINIATRYLSYFKKNVGNNIKLIDREYLLDDPDILESKFTGDSSKTIRFISDYRICINLIKENKYWKTTVNTTAQIGGELDPIYVDKKEMNISIDSAAFLTAKLFNDSMECKLSDKSTKILKGNKRKVVSSIVSIVCGLGFGAVSFANLHKYNSNYDFSKSKFERVRKLSIGSGILGVCSGGLGITLFCLRKKLPDNGNERWTIK